MLSDEDHDEYNIHDSGVSSYNNNLFDDGSSSSYNRNRGGDVASGGASADPFYAFRDEVELKVQNCARNFKRWKDLLETTSTATNREFQQLHRSLQRDLKPCREGVQELEQVVEMVESKRSRFPHISDEELENRKRYVDELRQQTNRMEHSMNSKSTTSKIEKDKHDHLLKRSQKYDATRAGIGYGMEDTDQPGILHSRQQQQALIHQEQDQTLDQISSSLNNLHGASIAINEEITSQNHMLDELTEDVDTLGGRMENVLSRLDKMLKTKSRCQTYTILFLCALLLLLILLVSLT